MINLSVTPMLSEESFKYSPSWLKKISTESDPNFTQVLFSIEQLSWELPYTSLSDCWLSAQNENLPTGLQMSWLDANLFFNEIHVKLPGLLVDQARQSFDHGYRLEVLPFEKKQLHIGLMESLKFIGLEINLGHHSELELFIDYQGIDQPQELVSQFIKINLEPHSRLQLVERRNHLKVARAQRLMQVQVHEGARFIHFVDAVQSQNHYWRNQVAVNLLASSSFAQLYGAFDLKERGMVETESWVQHLSANTQSDQIYKSVAHQESSHVFLGHVYMAPHCNGSNAAQMSKALLLSDQADLKYKPYLDIHCDDVKATHGTAISALQPEELFYLMARGLKPDLAKQLLQYAFLEEVKYHAPQ